MEGAGALGPSPSPPDNSYLSLRFLFPSLSAAAPAAVPAHPASRLGGPGLGRPGRDLVRGAAVQQFGFRGFLDLEQHPGLGVEGQADQPGRWLAAARNWWRE